jgi:hypothetical protein
LPVLAALAQDGLEICPPAEISDLLKAVLSLNRERNDHIWHELKVCVQLLNEIGIHPVLLKGAAYMACGLYSEPGARYLQDVDLLLPETQLHKAVEYLLANGYAIDETDTFGRFRHHHPQLNRGSVSIELHHKLGLGSCHSILPAKEVIECSTFAELDGVRLRVPSPTHLAMHLVMHSQLLHPYNERIWPPLRALYDLVQLQQRFGPSIQWAVVRERFRGAGQDGLLLLHLLDARDALGFKLPFPGGITLLTRLRQFRRSILRHLPTLRYLDPVYMFSTLFTRRLRVMRNVLATPGGARHLVSKLFAPGIYQRLFLDVIEGRGH